MTDREQATYFRTVRDDHEGTRTGRIAEKAYFWFSDAAECQAVGLLKRAAQSRRNGERWARKFHEWRRGWAQKGIACP